MRDLQRSDILYSFINYNKEWSSCLLSLLIKSAITDQQLEFQIHTSSGPCVAMSERKNKHVGRRREQTRGGERLTQVAMLT